MEKLFYGRGKSTPQTQTPKRPRGNDSPELIEFEKLTAEERQLAMFSQIVETKGEVQARNLTSIKVLRLHHLELTQASDSKEDSPISAEQDNHVKTRPGGIYQERISNPRKKF